MNSDEGEVFSDTEDQSPFRAEEEGEGEANDEDGDAKVFSAWVQLYKVMGAQKNTGEEEKHGGVPEGEQGQTTSEVPVPKRTDRRASLPCPVGKPAAILALK